MCAAFNNLKKVKLAGVPEQVNIPINICLEKSIFLKYGLDVEYKVVPEGTGAMIDKLESDEVDVAITVTDGFVVGCSKGRNIRLGGVYVQSPLIWAVATSPESVYTSIADIANLEMVRIGVSRMGSGSHTMAYYLCMKYNISIEKVEFIVANTIHGLTEGVRSNNFDIFLWETTTTQPLFSSNHLKKIGDVSAPWPAFSFVTKRPAADTIPTSTDDTTSTSTTESVSSTPFELQEILRNCLFPALKEGIEEFLNNSIVERDDGSDEAESSDSNKNTSSRSIDRICREFQSTTNEAQAWMDRTRYAVPDMAVYVNDFATAVSTLQTVGLVPLDFRIETLWGTNPYIALEQA